MSGTIIVDVQVIVATPVSFKTVFYFALWMSLKIDFVKRHFIVYAGYYVVL